MCNKRLRLKIFGIVIAIHTIIYIGLYLFVESIHNEMGFAIGVFYMLLLFFSLDMIDARIKEQEEKEEGIKK